MFYRVLFALLCAALLAGCALFGPPTVTQRQTVDGLTIVLERRQDAELLKETTLTVTLTDTTGKPVDGASVFFDLDMPSMPMGQNQPIADPIGGGRYQARTIFNMAGDWRVGVTATVAGKQYSATFDQPVK